MGTDEDSNRDIENYFKNKLKEVVREQLFVLCKIMMQCTSVRQHESGLKALVWLKQTSSDKITTTKGKSEGA